MLRLFRVRQPAGPSQDPRSGFGGIILRQKFPVIVCVVVLVASAVSAGIISTATCIAANVPDQSPTTVTGPGFCSASGDEPFNPSTANVSAGGSLQLVSSNEVTGNAEGNVAASDGFASIDGLAQVVLPITTAYAYFDETLTFVTAGPPRPGVVLLCSLRHLGREMPRWKA
jgi:hypothetical protein